MKTPLLRAFTPLGQRGIALPLALLGLVAVTLLITTVVLTSGTDYAMSTAQRESERGLYNSDAALEQYVAQQAQANLTNRFVEGSSDSLDANGVRYGLSLARLSRIVTPQVGNNPMTSAETWSIIAAPKLGRGRGALLRVTRTLTNGRLNVNSGFTSGGNVKVFGSAKVSSGATGQVGCDSSAAPYSVEVTAGSSVTSGTGNLEGTSHVSTTTQGGLMNSVLGMPLDSLALQTATTKFGPLFTAAHKCNDRADKTCPTWPNTVRPNDSNTDTLYNWGCPVSDIGSQTCTTAGATRFVVVAIDASNIGGSVKLNGDWGQGVLMILHGSLEIQGNFVFRGIVLVDKDLKITGGNGPFKGKLEGTVVAFGDNSSVEDDVGGNATIRYNRCSINDAQSAMNSQRIDQMQQVLSQPTFAWFELVR